MSADMAVAGTAYATARALGASDKVMLALFEAGIVESGMRNLSYGDRDSVGFLQQRAGWGTVGQRMNAAFATTAFVVKAKAKESKYSTAGQLAQGVQVSAFPARYDAVAGQAQALINSVSGNASSTSSALTPVADVTPVSDTSTGYAAGTGKRLLYGLVGFIAIGLGAKGLLK